MGKYRNKPKAFQKIFTSFLQISFLVDVYKRQGTETSRITFIPPFRSKPKLISISRHCFSVQLPSQTFASVVSVDNGKDTPGFESHFGTFVVAGGSAYAACPVAVAGKPLAVQRSAPDAFEGLFRTSDAEFKAVSLSLVRIEAADGISGAERYEVDEVYQRVDLVQFRCV